MGSMNDITRGSMIRFKDALWEVTDNLHARTGQRKPTMWTRLRNFKTGKVVENQFTQSDNVEFVRIVAKRMEYLYRDGNSYVFMDKETYEQPSLAKEFVAHALDYMLEGLECDFLYDDDEILKIRLPDVVEIEVTEAMPHARGDTATNDLMPVTIATGATVRVPPFIKVGDQVKIDTRTGAYLGRVK
jgi:elongation factor P